MAKPATVPTWDTNSTNVATPPAGYQSDGWSNGETVKSSYFNWFMKWAGAWAKWLDDGDWEAVDLALSGSLSVVDIAASGDVTAGGDVSATGALKFSAGASERVPLHLVSDNASATSCTTHTRGRGSIILAASATALYAPIPIRNDEVITGYFVGVQKNDTSGPVAAKIVSVNDSGETDESASMDTGVLTGNVALADGGLAIAGGKYYYVKITPSGGVAPSADRITSVSFTFTRP